jgi:thiamine-phosphate pyrophosphorylase
MQKRHPRLPRQWPRLWLMTDERMGDRLLPSIAALPKGSGIIFRHYSLPQRERLDLFVAVRKLARRRRHSLFYGGSPKLARALGADGAHGRYPGTVSAPVHNEREMITAKRLGAAMVFVSPVFATASHPGAKALGWVKFGMLVRGANLPIIALGGMTKPHARSLGPYKIYGWAAIDSLMI